MRSSRILLLLLAVTVVASLYYAWQNMPTVQFADSDPVSASQAIDATNTQKIKSDRFDFSGGEQRTFSKPRRNLFGQLFPPPPPAPKPKMIAQPVAPPAIVVAPVTPPPPPMPISTPGSRMPAFQVLGFLEKGGQLTAFVSLQGEIYLVKKEQRFADEFRVAELNLENITIVRVSGVGQVSLPLNDKSDSIAAPGGVVGSPASRGINPITRPVQRPVSPFALPDGLPAMPPAHPPIDGEN